MIEWLTQTLTTLDFVIISLVIGSGAALQGAVGYGMAMVATPILILIEPRLIPGPFILSSELLSILIVRREWRSIDLDGIKWAIAGRIPGTIAAGLILAVIAKNTMVLIFGFIVLFAVGLSVIGIRFSPRRNILVSAGVLSGIMGTIASIGGPPMALVYQHEDGEKIRPTLSGFFIFGSLFAVATLIVVGQFGRHELWLTMTLLPGIAIGYLVSSRLLPLLTGKYTREAVLTLATISALVVIVRQVVG
jgi:uncharacterized membrane protein YfcA